MTSFDDVETAIRTAQAAWTGCDWDTEFGARRANLRGLRSRQARLAAQATRGDESLFWRDVYRYLETVEQDAHQAAELANQSVEAWKSRDVQTALQHLDNAIALEARYRQPLVYPPLRLVIAEPMTAT